MYNKTLRQPKEIIMIINGFSKYSYNNEKVFKEDGTKLKCTYSRKNAKQFKMKNDNGEWKSVSMLKLKKITGDTINIPTDAQHIPGYNGYMISKDGKVFSKKRNKELKHTIGTSGYPYVSINSKPKDVHALLAKTFLMEDYVKKGLCCMHKDDNKLNCTLENICIGTYSQNNKDAYSRKLNKGNKFGVNKKIQLS